MQNQQQTERREFKWISTNDLLHDPDNPRVPKKFKHANPDEIIQYFLHDQSILELMGAIAEVGFFPGEPLLIVPAPEEVGHGKYYVVEGNRRLTAVKLLLNPSLANVYKNSIEEIVQKIRHPETLIELPTVIYESKSQVLDYLGYRHVTGIKPWGPFEKATYLTTLALSPPYSEISNILEKHKALASVIGSSREYVSRIMTALVLYNKAETSNLISADELEKVQEDFSLLSTSLYYGGIADYLEIDPKDITVSGLREDRFSDLLTWIFKPVEATGKPVVSESRRLKELNLVVQDDSAVATLKDTNDLVVATMMVTAGTKLDTFRNNLNNILKLLNNANRLVTTEELNLDRSDSDKARDIANSAKELNKNVFELTE